MFCSFFVIINFIFQVIKCLAREGVNLNSQMGKGELGITFAAQRNLSKMLSALLGGKLGYIVRLINVEV